MIHYVVGDLLQSDCEVIAHQANCFSKMYSGIAGQIRKIYPDAVKADEEFPFKPALRLGGCSFCDTVGTNGLHKRVYNLYGQYSMGTDKQHTDYKALESALDTMMIHLEKSGMSNVKIGVPWRMGCGLGGGDWNVVEEILKRVSERHRRDIYIYQREQDLGS